MLVSDAPAEVYADENICTRQSILKSLFDGHIIGAVDRHAEETGIGDNYRNLISKYPHASQPIPREQIETAIESLKQKGFGHLFEYQEKPYYTQTAECVKPDDETDPIIEIGT